MDDNTHAVDLKQRILVSKNSKIFAGNKSYNTRPALDSIENTEKSL